MTRQPAAHSTLRLLLVSALAGLASAAMWWAWLGWDHSYYLVDGVDQGPYRPWQVVGCALAVAAICVVARLWARRPLGLVALPAVTTIGFAVPWSIDAASTDDTGLWGVGLMMILVGGCVSLLLVLVVVDAVLQSRDRRRSVAAH